MSALRLLAPGKINWTLEVVRIRPDGYHELRSVLQTIELHDTVTLTPADEITIDVSGEPGPLAFDSPRNNLAYRAAAALRDRAGVNRGVRIQLEKRVPIAAGLGGGSSDAAAVLRGLNVLWDLHQPDINLMEVAAEIGSDPPFFIVGGTAAVRGRGEQVEPLPDALSPPILLALPPENDRGEKTAAMFNALTPDDFAEGDVTLGVRETVEAHRSIVDEDLNNIFEHVAGRLQQETAIAMEALRSQGLSPHLCGAGPSFFLLLSKSAHLDRLSARIRDLGFEPRLTHSLPRERALHIEEL